MIVDTLLRMARHPSGYERAKAVVLLAESTTGEELPLLLERSNDWVPQVRNRAQAALVARLTPEYAYFLACVLDQINQQARLGRADHAPFIRAVHSLLLSPGGQPALLRACEDAPLQARGHCRLLAVTQLPGELGVVWLTRALSDEAVWLRKLAARQAAQSATVAQLVVWTREQSLRPPTSIGLILLYALVERFPEAAAPVLDTLLLSRYVSLRRAAQFYAQRHRDVTAFYLALLPEPYALLGLGELGAREAETMIAPLAQHPRTAVRKAALKALGQLAPIAHKPLFLAALSDPAPGMRRVAREALQNQVTREDEARLVEIGDLRLLAALPRWQAVYCLVEQGAIAHLEAWLASRNANSTLPTSVQAERLSQALANDTTLPASLHLALRHELTHAQKLLQRASRG